MAWDQKTRQQAVDLYVTDGASEASRQTGVPVRTVRRWASDAGLAAARDERLRDGADRLALHHRRMREELRVRLMEKALDALERMDEPHKEFKGNTAKEVLYDQAPADAYQRYATSAAILIDKYRLEMGEHTAHSRSESSDDVDRRIAQLVDEHERRSQADDQPTPVG